MQAEVSRPRRFKRWQHAAEHRKSESELHSECERRAHVCKMGRASRGRYKPSAVLACDAFTRTGLRSPDTFVTEFPARSCSRGAVAAFGFRSFQGLPRF